MAMNGRVAAVLVACVAGVSGVPPMQEMHLKLGDRAEGCTDDFILGFRQKERAMVAPGHFFPASLLSPGRPRCLSAYIELGEFLIDSDRNCRREELGPLLYSKLDNKCNHADATNVRAKYVRLSDIAPPPILPPLEGAVVGAASLANLKVDVGYDDDCTTIHSVTPGECTLLVAPTAKFNFPVYGRFQCGASSLRYTLSVLPTCDPEALLGVLPTIFPSDQELRPRECKRDMLAVGVDVGGVLQTRFPVKLSYDSCSAGEPAKPTATATELSVTGTTATELPATTTVLSAIKTTTPQLLTTNPTATSLPATTTRLSATNPTATELPETTTQLSAANPTATSLPETTTQLSATNPTATEPVIEGRPSGGPGLDDSTLLFVLMACAVAVLLAGAAVIFAVRNSRRGRGKVEPRKTAFQATELAAVP